MTWFTTKETIKVNSSFEFINEDYTDHDVIATKKRQIYKDEEKVYNLFKILICSSEREDFLEKYNFLDNNFSINISSPQGSSKIECEQLQHKGKDKPHVLPVYEQQTVFCKVYIENESKSACGIHV